MKITLPNHFLSIAIGLSLVALTGHVQAQAPAHYVPGAEGLMGASVPGPGFYVRDYNLFYLSSELNDRDGSKVKDMKFNAFAYAQVPRLIWVTDRKVLGAYLGTSILYPFTYQHLSVNTPGGKFDKSTFGDGDFMADLNLTWHPGPFDIVFADGFCAPTGDSAAPPTVRVGQGFWTNMVTAGIAWNSDPQRTWNVSALSRFETNNTDRDTHVTIGDVYTLEWGISRKVVKTLDAGVCGYCQTKVTKDSGPVGTPPDRDNTAAVGPELLMAFPKEEAVVSLRYEYEFIADNRAQGHVITLTVTKKF